VQYGLCVCVSVFLCVCVMGGLVYGMVCLCVFRVISCSSPSYFSFIFMLDGDPVYSMVSRVCNCVCVCVCVCVMERYCLL